MFEVGDKVELKHCSTIYGYIRGPSSLNVDWYNIEWFYHSGNGASYFIEYDSPKDLVLIEPAYLEYDPTQQLDLEDDI